MEGGDGGLGTLPPVCCGCARVFAALSNSEILKRARTLCGRNDVGILMGTGLSAACGLSPRPARVVMVAGEP